MAVLLNNGFSNQKHSLPTILVVIQDQIVTMKPQAHVGIFFFHLQYTHEDNITIANDYVALYKV